MITGLLEGVRGKEKRFLVPGGNPVEIPAAIARYF